MFKNLYTHFIILTLCIGLIPMISHAQYKKPRIAVIGAGLAGLTTAYRLVQQGFDVNVYEAKSHVGGRILTAYVNNIPIELGGQNILDGGEALNTVQLIQDMGLELQSYNRNFGLYYMHEGTALSLHDLVGKRGWTPDYIYDQLSLHQQTSSCMKEVIDKLFPDENDPLAHGCKVLLAAYEGGTPDKLSVKYIQTLYHILMGGLSSTHQINTEKKLSYLMVKGGNSLLTQALANKLGDKLHTSMPLTALTKTASGTYLLSFDQHSSTIEADIIVLALPCSVYHTIRFNNTIPENRLKDFYNVGRGTTAKTIIPVNTACYTVNTCADNRIIASYHQEMKSIIIYHTGQAGDFTPETLSVLYQKNLELIKHHWNPLYLPHVPALYAQDQPFVSYTSPIAYSWVQDPYIQCSYSYIAAGQEEKALQLQDFAEEQVRTMFAPIDATLYFAGEHTTIMTDILGTLEAACESGERTARLIAKT